jgi:threonine dehydrogenase-like Zn-dependent dehydrogenase
VFHGVGDIRLDEVPDPNVQEPSDAVVRLTASAICGTDLHFVRGTKAGMREGTVLGHEGVGVVEEVGSGVRNLRLGHRVVIPSTIGCGSCSYCRAGYYAQCDVANPNGSQAGTAFFGGPEPSGPFDGMQAELVRVPFANVGLVKLPDEVTDDQAIMLSDIFPTAWFGAKLAEVNKGDIVAVLGWAQWASSPSTVPCSRGRGGSWPSTGSPRAWKRPAARAPRRSTSTPRTRSRCCAS